VLPTDAAVPLADVPLADVPLALVTDVDAAAASAAAFSDIGAVIVVLMKKTPKKVRTSFLKKRSKKLLPLGIRGPGRVGRVCQRAKVFWFFFSKKNTSFLRRNIHPRRHPPRRHIIRRRLGQLRRARLTAALKPAAMARPAIRKSARPAGHRRRRQMQRHLPHFRTDSKINGLWKMLHYICA
jgi:hypothetical protein